MEWINIFIRRKVRNIRKGEEEESSGGERRRDWKARIMNRAAIQGKYSTIAAVHRIWNKNKRLP